MYHTETALYSDCHWLGDSHSVTEQSHMHRHKLQTWQTDQNIPPVYKAK